MSTGRSKDRRRGSRAGRQRGSAPGDRPHPALEPLTAAQAKRLVRLAETAVAERGLTLWYDGTAALVPVGGDGDTAGEVSAGLVNLARTVARLPRQQWRSAVAAHFDQMPPAGTRPQVPEDLKGELYLRLVCASTIETSWAQRVPEFVPGVLTVPASCTKRAVAMHFDIDSLGVPWETVVRIGLANLRRLKDDVEYVQSRDAEVAMLSGGMFTASRALVLETVLRESLKVENPALGCLVAMPARDLLLIHVLRDHTVVGAFEMLVRMATCFFAESPGPVSPHVYYVTGHEWQQVTDYTGAAARLQTSQQFSEALQHLSNQPNLFGQFP